MARARCARRASGTLAVAEGVDSRSMQGDAHEPKDLGPRGGGASGCRILRRRGDRAGAILSTVLSKLSTQPAVLLALLLFPTQLLARDGPTLARAARYAVHAAAGVPGVPRLPRARLALRILGTAALLPRPPFLAGP